MNFANEETVVMQMETSTGPQGNAGRGIVSIERTAGDGSPGTKDTYTITFTDGSTYSYQVTNGKDGEAGGGGIKEEKDPTVPAWAKQPSKPTYTAEEVGADRAGAASSAVGDHNVSDAAHEDIRQLIIGLSNRLNGIADSDDTTLDQLSEIVAYIKSNKSLIDAITTGKVSTSDVVDNLTTNVGTKVLSAAQGVVLKGLIDGVVGQLTEQKEANAAQDEQIAKKLNASELPTAINTALAQAKESGQFDGKNGAPGEPGVKGDPGEDYVLTEADKEEIAEMAAELVEVPEGGGTGGGETVIRSEETLAEGIIPVDTPIYSFTNTGLSFKEILKTWKIFYVQTYTTEKNTMRIHGAANNNQPVFDGINVCYQCIVFFSLGKDSNTVMWKRYGSSSAGNFWDVYSPAGHSDMNSNVDMETIRDISQTTGLFLRNYGAAATAEIKWKVSGLMKWGDAQ